MKLVSLISLIQNENMKIYRRIGTIVMIGLLLLAVIATGIIQKYIIKENTTDWRATIQAETTNFKNNLEKNPNLPTALQRHYEKQIQINEYRLKHNIQPIENNTIPGFMNMTTNLVSIITLFTVIVAAGSVASEFSWGTIKLLLIRPVTRSKILLAKYLSTIIFALLSLAILFLSSLLVGGILFGLENADVPYLAYVDGHVEEVSLVTHILTLYGYSGIELVMMATFAFMISAVFRSSSLAIGLTIFLLFTGVQVVQLLSKYSWAKFILFANTNLAVYQDGVPIVEGMTLSFSIGMLILYYLVFISLTWGIFNKRDITA